MIKKIKSFTAVTVLIAVLGISLNGQGFLSEAEATGVNGLQMLLHLDGATPNDARFSDSSGNNNQGIASTGIPRESRGAKLGSAVRFENGKYIEVAHNNNLDITGPLTITMWINTFNSQAVYRNSHLYHDLLTTGNSVGSAYALGISENYKLAFRSNGGRWYESSGNLIGPATWQFVSVVRDTCGNNMCVTFYLNGQASGSARNVGAGLAANNHRTLLGIGHNLARASNFRGGIDEVAVYNRALNAAQVSSLYSLNNTGNTVPADGSIPIFCNRVGINPTRFEQASASTSFTLNNLNPASYGGRFTWSVTGGGTITPGPNTRSAVLTRDPANPTQSVRVISSSNPSTTPTCNVTATGIPAPQVNFQTIRADIRESRNATFHGLNFVLSNATLTPVTINYRADGGTATAESHDEEGNVTARGDHDLSGIRSLTIPAGRTQVNPPPGVRIVNDFDEEEDEALEISIVSVSNNATIGSRSRQTITIHDDDTGPDNHRTAINPAIPANNVLLLNFDTESGTQLPRDSSGLSNNASRVRGSQYFPMVSGKSYEFNGSSSYLEIPASPSTNIFATPPSELTIEMWIYASQLNTMGNRYMLVNRGGGNGMNSYAFSIESDRKLGMWRNQVGFSAKSNATIPENLWTHIAFVLKGCPENREYYRDDNECRISFYINGVHDSTQQMNRGPALGDGITVFGASHAQPNQTSPVFNFKGKMDDIAVYNRALTCAEIANRAGITAENCAP